MINLRDTLTLLIYSIAKVLHELYNLPLINWLQGLTEDLKRPPDTLEDLKFVLRVIADIRDKSLEVELRYVDLQERYRTLLMYDIEVRIDHETSTKRVSKEDERRFSITYRVLVKSSRKRNGGHGISKLILWKFLCKYFFCFARKTCLLADNCCPFYMYVVLFESIATRVTCRVVTHQNSNGFDPPVPFDFKVPYSELELSTNITQAWDDLFMESRRVDASLVSVKKKFTEVRFLYFKYPMISRENFFFIAKID